MSNYRRPATPGGTYFFTVNLKNREQSLLIQQVAALRSAFHTAQRARPFSIVAISVLPDHLHCLWRLPVGDADNATRWRHIKTVFSRHIECVEVRSPSCILCKERGLWQRRFWERLIRDERDLRTHIDYVHYNPVKHGHVEHVAQWPHSSFHRYVREGTLPWDWGSSRP